MSDGLFFVKIKICRKQTAALNDKKKSSSQIPYFLLHPTTIHYGYLYQEKSKHDSSILTNNFREQ